MTYPRSWEKFWLLRTRCGRLFRPLSPIADIANFSEGWEAVLRKASARRPSRANCCPWLSSRNRTLGSARNEIVEQVLWDLRRTVSAALGNSGAK